MTALIGIGLLLILLIALMEHRDTHDRRRCRACGCDHEGDQL